MSGEFSIGWRGIISATYGPKLHRQQRGISWDGGVGSLINLTTSWDFLKELTAAWDFIKELTAAWDILKELTAAWDFL